MGTGTVVAPAASTTPNPAGDSSALLSVQKLTAGYGKLMILNELSLDVPAGQFVAVLGPNGSGKSTLLKTIYGLTDIQGGRIVLAGGDITGTPTDRMDRLGLAYVPQRENVFASMTVHDNLQLGTRWLKGKDATQALSRCFQLFPVLGQRLGQKAGKLSGGERQMLAMALGWLAHPRLMLLDEPSAGLSPLFVTEVFRTLQNLAATGITLLVVEQNARSILHWCDCAFVLREGQVAFQGLAAEILDHEETVKSYLGVAIKPRV